MDQLSCNKNTVLKLNAKMKNITKFKSFLVLSSC